MPMPRVLVVDPSLTVRHLCTGCCRSCGAEAVWADDVGAALCAVTASVPQVVLTALELPGLFGGSLIAALKASPAHRAIPIGLLTSSAYATERLGVYGPDRVIMKNGELGPSLGGFLGALGIPGRGGAPAPALRGRVLVIEDLVSSQLLPSRLLHVAGADVVVASHGAEAMDLAASHFELILIDIEAPVIDGGKAVAALRRSGVKTPIMAMTGLDLERFRPEAERLGFSGVLAKTADREALAAACGRYLAA